MEPGPRLENFHRFRAPSPCRICGKRGFPGVKWSSSFPNIFFPVPQRIDWLVVWNIFYLSIIYGIILPIDFHIFQGGWNHQPVDFSPSALLRFQPFQPWLVPRWARQAMRMATASRAPFCLKCPQRPVPRRHRPGDHVVDVDVCWGCKKPVVYKKQQPTIIQPTDI